jgi:hypothetical protein
VPEQQADAGFKQFPGLGLGHCRHY